MVVANNENSIPLVHDSLNVLQIRQKRARRFRDCGVREVVLILPHLWRRSEDDAGEFTVAKNHVAFHSGGYRLRAVENCQETSRRDTANKRSLELCASIVLIF